MKIEIIILSLISIFCFSPKSWSQETPKLAAFSIGDKAPENNSKTNITEPVMATWKKKKNNNNSKNKEIIVSELKTYKKETITESNVDK